jgi:putative transposase
LPTLTYQLGHDYGFKTAPRVSVLTLQGRVILPYTGYARHVALIQQGASCIGAAKLWYDKPQKQFYLLVSLEVEVPVPVPERHQRVVGVDVRQRYLAVATDTQNGMLFFPGKAARAYADHYARLRKRLQHQGTRSATRRLLIVLAGRERRLKHERNHQISRQIVDAYPHSLIGLEDLTHIRERAHTKRKHGKKASVKQRKANRHASQWAFAELHGYVAYKALLVAVWP